MAVMRVALLLVAGACISGCVRADDVKIAILRDGFRKSISYASPEKIANMLETDGYSTEFVSGKQLADPKTFNAGKYWLTVLPYGGCFPAEARENFLAYLKAGGDFLSTGGYAFDEPAIEWNGRWYTRI